MQMFDRYIMYIFIGAKFSHANLKNAGYQKSAWLGLMIWI